MKKTASVASALLGASLSTGVEGQDAQGVSLDPVLPVVQAPETPEQIDARLAWWREAKFGLFIHWGVYAVPAGKYGDNPYYGEWIMHSAKIPVSEYRRFAEGFNPTKYDPSQWIDIASDAGMRYVVITAKHHEGFALYPSDVTDWDIADATPYKRDLLGPLVEASRARGLHIGFYYSHAQDWIHRGGAKAGFNDQDGWDDEHKGSFDEYLSKIAVPQVRELLTRYPIDVLWWDTPSLMNRARAQPFDALLGLRPGIITNNRLGGGFSGDAGSPEQFVPTTGYPGDWETCMTMNNHWGYNAVDTSWKRSPELIRKLADICSKGGNFLLNVGPTAEGEFPAASVEILREIGAWLRVNGDSIYGTRAGPFNAPLSWGCATRKGKRLYLHVFQWPADGQLRVPLLNETATARLLVDRSKPLPVVQRDGVLVIEVPREAPDAVSTVVELDLESDPVVRPLLTTGASVIASEEDVDAIASFAIDGTSAKRWRAPKSTQAAWLELTLSKPSRVNGIAFDEPDVWPRLNQQYDVDVLSEGEWKRVASGKTDGHGVRKWFEPLLTNRLRISLECKAGAPGVAELLVLEPE